MPTLVYPLLLFYDTHTHSLEKTRLIAIMRALFIRIRRLRRILHNINSAQRAFCFILRDIGRT